MVRAARGPGASVPIAARADGSSAGAKQVLEASPMSDPRTPVSGRPSWVGRPIWVELASSDPAASRAFYARVFGWDVQVNPDPQYGGYAIANVDGAPVAGIGPKMSPDMPTFWSLYLGTDDVDALAAAAQAAGATIVVPSMVVGDQGRFAAIQDPSGAFVSAWQPISMAGFVSGRPNAFAWAELNARGIDAAVAFYESVLGWTTDVFPMGEGRAPYMRFFLDGQPVAGGMEMNPAVPASVPSYWSVYFGVADADATFRTAVEAGATEMMPPTPFPGGRFAILSDPEGAMFCIREEAGA